MSGFKTSIISIRLLTHHTVECSFRMYFYFSNDIRRSEIVAVSLHECTNCAPYLSSLRFLICFGTFLLQMEMENNVDLQTRNLSGYLYNWHLFLCGFYDKYSSCLLKCNLSGCFSLSNVGGIYYSVELMPWWRLKVKKATVWSFLITSDVYRSHKNLDP